MMNCRNCRWYDHDSGYRSGSGLCRKLPPKPWASEESGLITLWPEVSPDDWCGQWAAMNKEDRPAKGR